MAPRRHWHLHQRHAFPQGPEGDAHPVFGLRVLDARLHARPLGGARPVLVARTAYIEPTERFEKEYEKTDPAGWQ